MKLRRILLGGVPLLGLILVAIFGVAAPSSSTSGAASSPRSASATSLVPTVAVPSLPANQAPYAAEIGQFLAAGVCHIAVMVKTHEASIYAHDFVDGDSAPTRLCPKPDVVVVLDPGTSLVNGSKLKSRTVLFYGPLTKPVMPALQL